MFRTAQMHNDSILGLERCSMRVNILFLWNLDAKYVTSKRFFYI
jgi:hypothetical protein